MAKGRPKKIIQHYTEASLPDLVGQSFASNGYSRINPRSPSSSYCGTALTNLDVIDLPFSYSNGYYNAQDAIELCQKAYSRIPVFRTAIDIMTDLANTDLHLRDGNSQSLKFFEAWMKRIRVWNVKEQFFRECFRSGNIMLYRTDASVQASEILKLSQTYAKKIDIPIRYLLLNPAKIWLDGISFQDANYYKVMTKFELEQLKRSQDEDDQEVYKDIRKAINQYVSGRADPIIKLDPDRLHVVFYQKQDYEPFATPMGYSVLDDINLHLELKKCDAILSRTVEYVILLVTMGAKEEDGGTNPKAMEALKGMFQSEKIGRVLVSDYTTKASFVVPDLEKILNPAKYEEVNKNIAHGLMNIFFGEQKFADSVTKLRALVKKMENAQALFVNQFLQPEIKRISKQMNFKSYPQVYFEPIRLEDETNMFRVYAQLMQLGVLSPKDGIQLMDTGLLPDYQTIQTNQEEFKSARDKGHFQPMQGGPFDQKEIAKENAKNKALMQAGKTIPKASGRPAGTKAPQTSKKVGQTGTKASLLDQEGEFSQKKVAQNTLLYFKVAEAVEKEYKEKNNIKRLSNRHKETLETITANLVENEEPEKWVEKVSEYINEVPDLNMDRVIEIADIQERFEVSKAEAAILFHSKI